MRKIRPIALLALFLCAVMLLASCGIGTGKGKTVKALTFKEVVKQSTAEEPATATFEKLALEGTIAATSYPFAGILKEDNTKVIYNIEQNKVVFTLAPVDSVVTDFEFYPQSNRTSYFTVQVTDNTTAETKYQTSLYDASGNRIASVDKIEDPASKFDLVSFGGKIYRLGDTSATATLTALTAYSPLQGGISTINAANTDYYYETYSVDGVNVYDKNLNLLTAYRYEGNPDSTNIMILSNGNVAVQLRYQLPDTADNYTFMDSYNKYLMKTVIVNAKNGTVKEVSFNYYLTGGLSLNVDTGFEFLDSDLFAKNLNSFAAICPISENGILMNGSDDEMIVAVKDDLSIIGRIDAIVNNQNPGSIIENIYPGYFTVDLANGSKVLLNDKGEVIGNIAGADAVTYSYIYAGGKIFNYKLEEVYDYGTAGYTLVRVYEHSAILSKDSEYFLYNGTLTALDTKDDKLTANFVGNFYSITDQTDLLNVVTRYYNDKGELVLTLDKGATLTAVTNFGFVNGRDFGLYKTVDPETAKPVYYRVTF